MREYSYRARRSGLRQWPVPNIWLGTSVGNQAAADERISDLINTPAAVRFLSCEPLLGPVDVSTWLVPDLCTDNPSALGSGCIDWVIAGGESGRGKGAKAPRPMHPDWARTLRDQCAEAGVAFLFKQWGEWGLGGKDEGSGPDGRRRMKDEGKFVWLNEAGIRAGGATFDPPLALGGRSWALMKRVGKKRAGRVLDGRTHDGFPKAIL